MKLFSFPAASLEKAIHKRILTLPSPPQGVVHRTLGAKALQKAFVENKAMPLVTLVAKGKTWDDATFAEAMQDWDVTFYEAEAEVLRPLIRATVFAADAKEPAARARTGLLDKLTLRRDAIAAASTTSPEAPASQGQ